MTTTDHPPSLTAPPDHTGRFGDFGGRFVPETLIPACFELEAVFDEAWADPVFRAEFEAILRDYAGRPSILTECHNLGERLGIRLILKREDLNHTGSHKINNVIGQALLAKRMGKKRMVADTGAGQHGVASATAAALMGLECKVYMGAVDVERQALNVFRMRLLGAEVESVESGSRTLKDAVNEAMRHWVATVADTHFCLGSVVGPHPYPYMVRQFQSIIGDEANAQCRELLGAEVEAVESGSRTLKDAVNDAMRDWVASVRSTHYCIGSVMGPHPYPWMVREFQRIIGDEAREQCRAIDADPDVVVACVGGGSNAAGIFAGFADTDAELVGVEPAGGAALGRGVPGVVHGMRSYLLQDEWGQVLEAESISAGLDSPGVGPEHSHLSDLGRATYVQATDEEVVEAFQLMSRSEGIIPALETAHAIAYVARDESLRGKTVLINFSGRGDKDVGQMMDVLG